MDKFKELSGGLKLALVIPGALTALFTFWVQFIYPDFDAFKRNTSVEVHVHLDSDHIEPHWTCLLYTSPSPRDRQKSRMPSSA